MNMLVKSLGKTYPNTHSHSLTHKHTAQFQNPAVVDALIRLLEDPDPNVRAVAAVSLGRTGNASDDVVDNLITLLKDADRIVRQGACLSLGHLKAEKAVPHIGHIW